MGGNGLADSVKVGWALLFTTIYNQSVHYNILKGWSSQYKGNGDKLCNCKINNNIFLHKIMWI